MSSAWSQLEQLLTCAICLDRFKNPKLLPCQHTFCGEPCMEGLVDYARRQIKCPECRAEHRIPYQGIQTFPTNVTLMRFLELHQSITGEEPEPVPSMMERCGVCTEKSMVERCVHCEKKICTECKEAHLDILKREISRINSQVRRALTRLEDTISQTDRNSERLVKNQIQIKDEIEETVRRFVKDIKDKENKLLHELDEYVATELTNLAKLKEDLDIESKTIGANCDLIEKHVIEQNEAWTDVELVEYKDIFNKSLEFLRNFDTDSSDFSKRIKFQTCSDIDMLRRNLVNFGELKLPQPDVDQNVQSSQLSSQSSGTSLNVPQQNMLMRSQSDHRLAAQFARREGRLSEYASQSRLNAGGFSDTERDGRNDRSTSPTGYGRNRRESTISRYNVGDSRDNRTRYGRDSDSYRGWNRDEDSDSGPHFRSRFMREKGSSVLGLDEADTDYGTSHRSVRFEEPSTQPVPKVFDIQTAPRGPLSGVVKLSDSAHFMERLHENEARSKVDAVRKEEEAKLLSSTPTQNPVYQPPPMRRQTSRQVSEDEIEKQKKANKAEAAAAAASASTTASLVSTTTTSHQPVNSTSVTAPSQSKSGSSNLTSQPESRYMPRRVTTLRDEDDKGRRGTSDSSSSQSTQSTIRDTDTSTLDDVQIDDEESNALRLARRRRSLTAGTELEPRETPAKATATSARQVDLTDGDSSSKEDEEEPEVPQVPYVPSHQSYRRSSLCSTTPLRSPGVRPTLSRPSSIEIEPDSLRNFSSYRNYERSSYQSRYGSDSSRAVRPSMAKTASVEERDVLSDNRRNGRTGADMDNVRQQTTLSSTSSYYNRMSRQSVAEEPEEKADPEDDDDEEEEEESESDGEAGETDSEPEPQADKNGATRQMRNSGSPSNYSNTKSNQAKDAVLHPTVEELLTRSAQVRRDSVEFRSRLDPDGKIASRLKSQRTLDDLSKPSKVEAMSDHSSSKYSLASGDYFRTSKYSDTYSPTQARTSGTSNYATNRTNPSLRDPSATEDTFKYNRRDSLDGGHLYKSSTDGPSYSRVSRSKSSHSIISGGHGASDEEEDAAANTSYKTRQASTEGSTYKGSGYQYRTREPRESRQRSPVNDDHSSGPSAWSQYLRNKYASSRKSSLSGSTGSSSRPSVLTKSKSSHAVYNRTASDSSDEEGTNYRQGSRDSETYGNNRRGNGSGYGFALPRSMYLQKRRMAVRVGTRGTEPGCFTWPRGVAVGLDNNIVVADSSNHRIQVFDSTGRFLFEFGSYGSNEGEFDCPAGVAVNRIGQFIVSDRYNHRIQIFDPSGRFLRAFGCEGRSDGRFSYPWGITTDSLGFIYICDKENHRIQVFQSDGTFVGKFGSIGSRPGLLEHPHYIAVSNTNRVIVSDSNNHRVQIFDVNGRSLSTFGTEGSEEGQFKFPRGIAVDDQGYIIVGDSGNNRIQIFNPDGSFLKSFGAWGSGEGEFKGLEGVAVTTTGNILVCDRENHRIQVF